MRRVIWTDQATEDLDNIRAYIARDNPLAAQRLAQRIVTTADQLFDSSERGRPISQGRREIVSVRPYLIRYRVQDDRVYVLEVRHGARDDGEATPDA